MFPPFRQTYFHRDGECDFYHELAIETKTFNIQKFNPMKPLG